MTNTAIDDRLVRRSGAPSPTEPVDADVIVPASFFRDLEDIAAANRVLASRVAELNAEVERQIEGADRLRERLAIELQRNLSVGAKARRPKRPPRSHRRSSLPRRAYRRVRRMVRPR